jgi:hypothetical protein
MTMMPMVIVMEVTVNTTVAPKTVLMTFGHYSG